MNMNMNINIKDNFGFILTRHVTSIATNKYWNNSLLLLRTLYPLKRVIIIDDNSDYTYVSRTNENVDNNNNIYSTQYVTVIQSEYTGRGELLPYYYLLKHRYFENAVILHDSVFFHRRLEFEKLKGQKVVPLWHFNSDRENIGNTLFIATALKNSQRVVNRLKKEGVVLGMDVDKWNGCFGVQSYINLSFLEMIESKYKITNLISKVRCRADRCCLERIMGCIFCVECPQLVSKPSLFGDIMQYQSWGYTYDAYMTDVTKGLIPKHVIKVWTGR